jgi:hypothetical protein
MANRKPITVYADPSHAWAKISLEQLNDVNLSFQHISGYSYFKGTDLYLEEDADLSLFVAAYQAKYGEAPDFKERYSKGQSSIRKLPRVRGSDSSPERQRQLILHFQAEFIENHAA